MSWSWRDQFTAVRRTASDGRDYFFGFQHGLCLDAETFEFKADPDAPPPLPLSVTLHNIADNCGEFGWCYFIGGVDGPIKIGFSVSVKDRLRNIQTCSPVELCLLAKAPGGRHRESAYHYQFQDHRLHGEWFERCDEIEAEIRRLNGHDFGPLQSNTLERTA
jgi:hypothetical protein